MIPANSPEVIFAVLGAVVGVLFILDGWRGSAKPVNFLQQPRVRAFLYMFGGFVASAISSLTRAGAVLPGDRSRVIEMYLLWFVTVGGCTLLLVSLVLLLQMAFTAYGRRHALSRSADLPALPILDYVHYGYSQFLARRDAELNRHDASEAARYREYLETYSQGLAVAFQQVNHLRKTREGSSPVAVLILSAIKTVMEDFLEIPKTNVNYMRAYAAGECPETIRKRVRFAFGDHARYSHYLCLVEYAKQHGKEVFALPVESAQSPLARSGLLQGAPVAFQLNKPVYIRDTARIEYPKGIPAKMVAELKEYFRDKPFQSFLSIPILGAGGFPVGVLNIDSDHKYAFGRRDDQLEYIAAIISPLSGLLGAIIAMGDEDEHNSAGV